MKQWDNTKGFTGSCTWQSHVVSPWWLHWRSPYGGHTAYLLRNCLQWPHKRDFLDKPDSEAKTQIVSHGIQQQMLQEISLQPDGMCHALRIGKIEPLSSDSVLGVVFFVQFVLPSHRFDHEWRRWFSQAVIPDHSLCVKVSSYMI